MEEELHERPLYRRFVIPEAVARLPFESTFLRFWHLLENTKSLHRYMPPSLLRPA